MVAIQQTGKELEQGGTLFFTLLHLACLAILIILTWFRSTFVGKNWLVVLPFIAAAFDFIPGLSLIPLVPTVMHLLAVILGVSSTPTVSEDT